MLLNCIYLNTFTAMDQLSVDKFDVEHIAPKEQMRKLIDACKGDGLPVSCIANLCYLPEKANRSKGAKNFYQDKKYLVHIDLNEVENKYSFTEAEDLEWMDMPYEQPEDFKVLKEYYTDYCTKRFEKMKHLFCESLGIKYDDYAEEDNTDTVTDMPEQVQKKTKKTKVNFSEKCAVKLAEHVSDELIKVGRNAYVTSDGKKGFLITTSRMYNKGGRERYWFAYRKNPLKAISNFDEQYIVYGCKDENTIVVMPVTQLEKYKENMRVSWDDEGNITHWHVEFYKDKDKHFTWMMSKPVSHEIDIDKFLI